MDTYKQSNNYPTKSHAIVIPPTITEKFKSIAISINSCPIYISECVKYLGILIDSKLQFGDHISNGLK